MTHTPHHTADSNGHSSPNGTPASNGHPTNGFPALNGTPVTNGHDLSDSAPVADSPKSQASTNSLGEGDWQVQVLDVRQIVPSPFQPRENFEEEALRELAQSIKAYGVQQPLLVRPLPPEPAPDAARDKAKACAKAKANGQAKAKANGQAKAKTNGQAKAKTNAKAKAQAKPRYELVAGERRWRACQIAGRLRVPAFVRPMSDLAAAEIAVLENVQRANLSIIEEARGYKRLALQFRLKEERIAKKVGKSPQTIRDTLRLLALPESVQRRLAHKQLSAAHGHELLRLSAHPRVCEAVAERAVRDKLSASSLSGNLLPNAAELRRAGLLVELGYGTRFDWRTVCRECPHRAFVATGGSAYCLQPPEWERKQTQALELQSQEAAQLMAKAREQHSGTLERETLRGVPHRRLEGSEPPAGCSTHCPCRGETFDEADPTKRVPVCLDPERLRRLRDEEDQAQLRARQERFTGEWQSAMTRLGEAALQQTANGHCAESDASLAALLVWPILRAESRGYVAPDVWHGFVLGVATHLECELPLDELLHPRATMSDGLQLLRKVPSHTLLLLGAGLLLGQEVERAIRYGSGRYGSDTPLLDFVLERQIPKQTELETNADKEADSPESGFEASNDGFAEDEIIEDEVIEAESEVEESYFGPHDFPQHDLALATASGEVGSGDTPE